MNDLAESANYTKGAGPNHDERASCLTRPASRGMPLRWHLAAGDWLPANLGIQTWLGPKLVFFDVLEGYLTSVGTTPKGLSGTGKLAFRAVDGMYLGYLPRSQSEPQTDWDEPSPAPRTFWEVRRGFAATGGPCDPGRLPGSERWWKSTSDGQPDIRKRWVRQFWIRPCWQQQDSDDHGDEFRSSKRHHQQRRRIDQVFFSDQSQPPSHNLRRADRHDKR